jgi:hypothetical protein
VSTNRPGQNPLGDQQRENFFARNYNRARHIIPHRALATDPIRNENSPSYEPDPRIAAALSLEDINAQIEALKQLEAQAIATANQQARAQALNQQAIDESTKKIRTYYDQVRKSAIEENNVAGLANRRNPNAARDYAGDFFPQDRTINAGTNMTQQELYMRQRQMAGDDNPFYPSSENLRLRDVAKGVLHGNLRPSQALLAPGALLFDAMRQGALQPTVDPATGAIGQSRIAGKFFGSALGRGTAGALTGAGVGLGGLFAASQAIPYALEGVQRVYNEFAGNDIQYGQQAGMAGNQGLGGFTAGIGNRLIEPFNLLGGLVGLPQLGPFGSQAAQFGSQRRLDAFRAGFNPFDALSIREAEGIQREVLNRGYRAGSRQEEDVIQGLYRLRNTTGGDSGQALDYMDIFVKRFNFQVDDVIQDLEGFAEAAQAAGKSVDEFTKEVSANALKMTEAGVDPRTAANLARSYAGIPGVPGEAIAATASAQNPFFVMNAMRTNPEIFNDPARMALFMQDPHLAMGGDAAGGITGTVRSQMDMITQIYPSAADMTLEQRAALLKQFNIPGLEGLSARQIADIYENGSDIERSYKRSEALDPLQEAFNNIKHPNSPEASLFDFNPERRTARDQARGQLDELYADYMRTVTAESDLTKDQRSEIRAMIERRENPADIQAQVDRFLAASRGDTSDEEAEQQRVLVEASPELRKFFRFLEQTGSPNYLGGDKAYSADERNKRNPSDTTWGRFFPGYGG